MIVTMVGFYMIISMLFMSKSFLAKSTLKGSFSRVNHHVSRKITRVCECSITVVTFIWFNTSMHRFMLCQEISTFERTSTLITFKWSIITVYCKMHYKIRTSAKFLTTVATDMLFLASMKQHMGCKNICR